LAVTIRREIEDVEAELVPGGRGDFIVVADGLAVEQEGLGTRFSFRGRDRRRDSRRWAV
jgi:hypothetical protein